MGDPKVATQDRSRADGDNRKRTAKVGTLAKYIKDCGAEGKPSLRMLAVANWLHEKGQERIALSDITKAITDAKQKRLSNPSTFLKSNTTNGFVEGKSDSFYVTDEGREKLGLSD